MCTEATKNSHLADEGLRFSHSDAFLCPELMELLCSENRKDLNEMCSPKCSRCIVGALYVLLLLSIICNIVLFFPGGDAKYAREGHITEEVKWLGGVIGGGLVMLIPAVCMHLSEQQSCFGMIVLVIFAVMGGAGALYSFIVALYGVVNGPLCKVNGIWTTPFKNSSFTNLDDKYWRSCTEPKNVVQFNIILFSILMAISFLQLLLCVIQIINGLFGCLFGICINKEEG